MKRGKTLIYKRTHTGDPSRGGVFGNHDCMGRVRAWKFNSVIGVGGIGREARDNDIGGKLTWIGIGAHRAGMSGQPLVTFDHFLDFGTRGPLLDTVAPALAKRLYGRNVRVLMHHLSCDERREVEKILELARNAPASSRSLSHNVRRASAKCPPRPSPRASDLEGARLKGPSRGGSC
jgi:hypothetical protein